MSIRTRMAPSPTGRLHIWSVRAALFSYIYARKSEGKYIVRIEDTDTERSEKQFEESFFDGMERLWIEADESVHAGWDVGPYRQSERVEIYDRYIQQLLDSGAAYEAWETTEELWVMRDAQMKATKTFVYRKPSYTPEQLDTFAAEGRIPVVRFAVPDGETVIWNDLIKGETSFNSSLIGDFVIRKSDGMPTYHLAVVVDDNEMGISHVVRGEDHIANTPKHIFLYRAFGWDIPEHGHLPLILTPQKKKMSKRNLEQWYVYIDQYREEWFLPEALINFIGLLWWHGSDDREFYTIEEFIELFSFERVQSSNSIFDYDRLLRYNAQYISKLSPSDFTDQLQQYLWDYGWEEWESIIADSSREYREMFAPYMQPRMQTFWQFKDFAYYLFRQQLPSMDIVCNPKMKVTQEKLIEQLPSIIEHLKSYTQRDDEILQITMIPWIKEQWWKNGQVLRPIRAILTGVDASPGAFEMLAVIGKDESLARLSAFYTQLG